MSTAANRHTAIAFLTGKPLSAIMQDGGSQSWVLDPKKAIRYSYLVCCRSNKNVSGFQGPEPRGTAFLIGRISEVVDSTETDGRWLVKISEFAHVDLPETWQGWRNPVRYTTLEDLGINLATLVFEPMPHLAPVTRTPSVERTEVFEAAPLTIAQAKRGLARAFGVGEDAIEITIRG